MNIPHAAYRIFPLGDSAITIDFGNTINEIVNNEVVARFALLLKDPLPGMIEAVPAYSSLTIYYDVPVVKRFAGNSVTAFEWMEQQLQKILNNPIQHDQQIQREIKIPVCYESEFAPDIQFLANAKNISIEEVIATHTAKSYQVYMIGFLPGFPYLGEVDDKIAVPRKAKPQNVMAGSVGIAGKQTGIYPLASPGGWQIIGRTPLQLFDAGKSEPTLLKMGDMVRFYGITSKEFYEMQKAGSIKEEGGSVHE
jgi:inhibitor of KinA